MTPTIAAQSTVFFVRARSVSAPQTGCAINPASGASPNRSPICPLDMPLLAKNVEKKLLKIARPMKTAK